jgi:hypothetical protein
MLEPSSRVLPWLLGIVLVACDGADAQSEGTGGGSAASGGTGLAGTGGSTGAGTAGTLPANGGAQVGGSSTGGAGPNGGTGNAGQGGTVPSAGRGPNGGSGAGGGNATGGVGATAGGGTTSEGGAAGDDSGTSGLPGTGGKSGGAAGTGGSGGAFTGTCTESKAAGKSVSGSGPHDVVVETNGDPGIEEGTIFRPADLGGDEKYPIFVWGEGGCSLDGLSNATAMGEIASHGYFVIADGTPNGSGGRTMDRSKLAEMGAPLIAYVDWALAENEKPCSAYYHSLEPTKIASNGFSCGGLMSQGTVLDPRIVTWGVSSSGMAGAGQDFYDLIHTPVLFVEGGTGDVAYDGGLEGYQSIAELEVPVLWFSKDLGHGGDLFQSDGGDFTKINLAWLNWWLKGDETSTGKGMLVGSSCPYCSDGAWDVMSAHVP